MNNAGYQIKTVARLTGIPKNTLIAWERRYELVTPTRLKNGYRVYTANDLLVINRVKGLLEQGFKISEAAVLVLNDQKPGQSDAPANDELEKSRETVTLQADLLEAIGDYDLDQMDAVFEKASSLSIERLIDDIVIPVSVKVGENWATGKFNIAQEHFSSSFMKERLFSLFKQMKNEVDDSKKSILLACITGERHEIGLLSLGIKFRAKGHPVLYLGSDMPASEVADAAIYKKVNSIGLSVVNPVSLLDVLHYVERLRGMLPNDVKIFLGGNGTKEWKQSQFNSVDAQLGGSIEALIESLG